MRLIISSLLLIAGCSIALADIQDPPAKKYNDHRKFSRGIANIAYGSVEIPDSMVKTNDSEGNSAAFSLGVFSGTRRTLERLGVGIFEVVTCPFAINRGTYKPYFKSPTRGNHGTFTEFPPELGFDSSLRYSRN